MGLKKSISQETWEKGLETFLLKIFFQHLLINPKEHKVVVCEELTMPNNFKESLGKLLLKQFQIPSLLFVPSSLISLTPLELNTSLVIDIGASGLSITPIYQGNILIHANKVSSLGINEVSLRLKKLILEHSEIRDKSNNQKRKLNENDLTDEILNSVLRTLCVVPFKNSPNFTKTEAKFPFTGKNDLIVKKTEKIEIIIPLNVRTHSTEIFFEVNSECDSIATIILDSLFRCPYDTRLSLCKSILIKGGGYFVGMKNRIIEEIYNISNNLEKYNSFKILSSHFS